MYHTVWIPKWKAYLYTLIQRYRLYKWLNYNWVKLNFNRKEIVLLRSMFKNYVKKGVIRKARVYKYEALVKSVLVDNISIATKDEIELAMRLTWVNHIKTKELIMELAQIKEFGKEVGLKPLAMGKMDEDTLIIEVLKNVDPSAEYSQEFIAWYEAVPDEYFDAAETVDVNPVAAETEVDASAPAGDDFSELIEVINELTSVDDLKAICVDEDYGYLFESVNVNRYRIAKTLKAAMLEAIETAGTGAASGEVEVDDAMKKDMIEIINGITTEDEIIEFVSDEAVEAIFTDKLVIGDSIDIDELKTQMLALLGVEETAPEPEKPMTLAERMAAKRAETATAKAPATDGMVIEFDPNSFDIEAVYASSEALGIPQLRKFAKELGITAPAGSTKVDILAMVADKLTEMAEGGTATAESTAEAEVTITKSIVNDAIAADDKDTLQSMCEAFDIKLNALQKKSTNLMGKKLLEVVPDDAPANRDAKPTGKLSLKDRLKAKEGAGPDTNAPTAETQSIYQTIEEMVLAGSSEADITAAVKPYYAEKGKSLLFVKKRVKMMIEIVKGDNDLK